MKLYELNNEIEQLIDESVDHETGEIKDISEALEKLQMEKLDKVSNVVLAIKNESSFINAIDAEIETLTEKKRSIQNKTKWLKEYLARNLEVGKKIETPNFTISWRKSDSIEISDLVILEDLYEKDPRFVTKKIVYSPDKIAAKKIYKETLVLPEGFSFIEKQNLQIK